MSSNFLILIPSNRQSVRSHIPSLKPETVFFYPDFNFLTLLTLSHFFSFSSQGRCWRSGRFGKRRTTFLAEHAFNRTTFFFSAFSFVLTLCLWNCLIALSKVPHLMPALLMQLSITLVARFTCKPVQGVKTKQSYDVPNTAIIIMTPV